MESLKKGEFRIYALVNPLTGQIFYIGSSFQKYTCKRKGNHIEEARKGMITRKCEIIRSLDFKIEMIELLKGFGDLKTQLDAEQTFIDKYLPEGNIAGAYSIPPPMGGHNKTYFTEEDLGLLGTMPDYKLAKILNTNKYTLARIRRERRIISYAEKTGNNGKIKKGEKHRRWNKD